MTRRERNTRTAAAGLCACLTAAHATAQQPSAEPAQQPPQPAQTAGQPQAGTGIWERSTLLGDLGGVRSWLEARGLTFGLQETSEVFGNLTGGVHQGAAYHGLTQMGLGIDTEKALGWGGGTFNISALQIHGRSLSADNLHTLQPVSGIEALPSTRLWELWYQQSFWGNRLDLRIGQQSLDQEFVVSATAQSTFINSAMGWPALGALNLYAGGPAYPLSSLGVRVRARPTDTLTVLGGVFDDNPPGGPFDDDSQVRGAARSGTTFNLNTGALFIAEIQLATTLPGGLPGTYKLGGWYDTGSFPDPRLDTTGRSLADPDSTGIARMHRHNFSVYGVFDQTVFSPNAAPTVNVFARIIGAPGERNLVNLSANAGVTVKGPLPGRDSDVVGLGFGIAKLSPGASGLDRDVAFFTGAPFPVRSAESFIELTYEIAVAPWLIVQPDFQYIFAPGGGILNPNSPTQRIGNEAVFGLETAITF